MLVSEAAEKMQQSSDGFNLPLMHFLVCALTHASKLIREKAT